MRPQLPDIARSGNGLPGWFGEFFVCIGIHIPLRRITVFVIEIGQHLGQFGIIETGQQQVVAGLGQLCQFEGQQFLVPARIQRQAVVGDHIGTLLCGAQVAQFNDRDFGQFQLPGSGQPSMPGDDAVVAVHQDRIRPAKLHDAGRDLGDLRRRMRARIARIGQQGVDGAVFDLQVGGHRGCS